MHDTTAMLIELGAIILVLGLLGRLAGRVGFSPIPLYLLAGLAFGQGGILPLSASEEFVSTGAEIGVVLLLLLLGLEYSASELVTNLKTQYPSAPSTSSSMPPPAPPWPCCSAGARSPPSRSPESPGSRRPA